MTSNMKSNNMTKIFVISNKQKYCVLWPSGVDTKDVTSSKNDQIIDKNTLEETFLDT